MKFLLEYIKATLLEGRKEELQKKYPDADVDFFWSKDPSETKKYVAWILKQRNLAEKNNETFDVVEILNKIDFFHKNNVRFHQKDINSYKTFHDFEKVVDDVKSSGPSKTQAKKENLAGAEKLAENDKYKLYSIKTKKAAQTLGRGTHWCITMDNENYYEDYESQGAEFFYFLKKNPADDVLDKIAVASILGEFEIFDRDDNPLSEEQLRKIVGSDLYSKLASLFGNVGNFKNINLKLDFGEQVSDNEITRLFNHCNEFEKAVIAYKLPREQAYKFIRGEENDFLRSILKYYEYNKAGNYFVLKSEHKDDAAGLPQKVTETGKSWFKDGELYKLTLWDGETQYHKGFAFHRVGAPAIIHPDGSKEYWENGVRHRRGGAAITSWYGPREYWINGKRLSEDEYYSNPDYYRPVEED